MTLGASSSSAISTTDDKENQPPGYKMLKRKAGARKRRKMNGDLKRAEKSIHAYDALRDCCFRAPRKLQVHELITASRVYADKSEKDRTEWLWSVCGVTMSGQKRLSVRTDDGLVKCCQRCFAGFHGFSKSSLTRVSKAIRAGAIRPVHRAHQEVPEVSLKYRECHAWMDSVYQTYGDYMPDDQTVCLPCYNRTSLYHWYHKSPVVDQYFEYCQFVKLLREDFPFITFRKFSKFMQCHFCNQLDKAIKFEKVSIPSYGGVWLWGEG
jgi:hypothetical protein